jgi:hypothetical protein
MRPYDFSDSPHPIKFDIGDTVLFVDELGYQLEGKVAGVFGDTLHIPGSNKMYIQNKTACVLVRKAQGKQPPIATQAKYFHYAKSDGQEAMIGFQTYAELMHHLEPEKYPDPHASKTNLDAKPNGLPTPDSPYARGVSFADFQKAMSDAQAEMDADPERFKEYVKGCVSGEVKIKGTYAAVYQDVDSPSIVAPPGMIPCPQAGYDQGEPHHLCARCHGAGFVARPNAPTIREASE